VQRGGIEGFRVNVLHHNRGRSQAVLRIIWPVPPLDELNLPLVIIEGIQEVVLNRTRGLVLIGGPTGSGKSTLLAGIVETINANKPYTIVMIEDPIERTYGDKKSHIIQREVHTDVMNWCHGVEAALRQAPHVIVIGELRDRSVTSTIVRAAETGHLVLGTVHARNAVEVIQRLIADLDGSEEIRLRIASCVECIICQVLVPRDDGVPRRKPAIELMVSTPEIEAAIREGELNRITDLIEKAPGMQTMRQALQSLISGNVVDPNKAKGLASR